MSILSQQDGVALRVLTLGDDEHPDTVDETVIESCSGSYLCDCETCKMVRAQRIAAGVRTIRPPWVPKRIAA